MTTVRRLYFYGLVFISIEVVIWGVIGLLRTIFSSSMIGANSLLATGLSLVLVGLPIFWLHWRTAQRDASSDPVERSSRIRAIFLYGVLFATIGPILYALLAIINRGLVNLFGLPESSAWFGSGQTPLDNLLAIIGNLIALVYFWRVLRSDWAADLPDHYLNETRRFYRYTWVLVGLTITVSGVYNLFRYIFYTPGQNPQQTIPILAGGIALLLIGTPLWGVHWWVVQESLSSPVERRSLLRLVVLYVISLAGVIGVLTTIGSVINSLIEWLIGERQTFAQFIQGNSAELGAAIPLGVLWAYYGNILTREVAGLQDQPRRFALRRLYFYILSLLGLGVTLAGLFNIIEFIIRLIFRQNELGFSRDILSGALSALVVGMPLWLITWNDMQAEAARKDDPGDHARRSVVRKAYLYLVLFLFVVGAMVFSGQFLFSMLDAVLSRQIPENLGENLTKLLVWLAIDLVLLFYHLRALRSDSQIAQKTMENLHINFPTLMVSEANNPLNDVILHEIKRIAPRLPVAQHLIEQGVPDETMLGAKAVILPIGLAIDPPEALRLWLGEYTGMRLIIPQDKPGYIWLGQSDMKTPELARAAARAIRQMAEGETLRQSLPGSPWVIAGYILGGLFGLLLIGLLFSLMLTALFR